jgi:predicted dehydrogenase
VRIGVIGVGSLGFHHARLLKALPETELVGICDTDIERSRSVAEELGVGFSANLEDLLESVDAVTVAVPTQAHFDVATQALAHDCDLLIEKPVTSTVSEADELIRRAEERSRIIQVGHIERFNCAVRACEPYLDRPLFVESHRLAPFVPRGTDVPVVLDLMIHDIDLILSLVGEDVVDVRAVGVSVLSPSVDIANARLEFERGAVANITASRVSIQRQRKIRFFQPSGYISLRGDGEEPLRLELEAFVKAVRRESPVAVSAEEGRQALAVALEIVERIERHREHVFDSYPA